MKVVVETALNTKYWAISIQKAMGNHSSAVLPKLKTESSKLSVIFTFRVGK